MAANVSRPQGCGVGVASIYYKLCDLDSAWGVVLEALAACGVVVSLVFFMALLALVPFTRDKNRRGSVAPHAVFLVCTAGLFGLTFAFIVGEDLATCVSRRFLFGVLFAGCASCLLAQGARLSVLARTNSAPPAWTWCVGAVALWAVEVVINAEWLIITVVRQAAAPPCDVPNPDFAMALIYVMLLLLGVVAASASVMAGKYTQWKTEGARILASGLLSVGIWAAWVVMYVYGNSDTSWDTPTLAIALVANAWVFLVLVTIPQVCCSPSDDPDLGANYGVDYETILKERNPHVLFMENKTFSMDEPPAGSKPVSPYNNYSGHVRSGVYQPTELALITNPPDTTFHSTIPRVSAHSADISTGSTPSQHDDTPSVVYANGSSGRVLHRTSQW
ncbi:G-protein coupled receptor family C group 5 member C-like [Entelurus aequoreus]|uniref:G-protein coupled receptor family C group 5 member C-like n=1 Tax=Entelurus aequoreus TaxID=161455 RepID=UPI002B1D70FA|nr:G-protein coupled receptor family C group 5 member C-like [Entelurus aequoreus]XP_061886643.1 G-protein coupled receptor family C group 5 member C-like [Entelurus aequoreus]